MIQETRLNSIEMKFRYWTRARTQSNAMIVLQTWKIDSTIKICRLLALLKEIFDLGTLMLVLVKKKIFYVIFLEWRNLRKPWIKGFSLILEFLKFFYLKVFRFLKKKRSPRLVLRKFLETKLSRLMIMRKK